jgi:hypothetical protein
MLPPSFPLEKPDLAAIFKPANAQAVMAALDPAFAVDPSGLCCVVPYSFNRESLLVAHLRQLPSAGLSSLDIARAFVSFIAEVRAKAGATWLPTYCAFDCTKDRTIADRLVELGLAGAGAGVRPVGGVRFPALTGVLFGGRGAQPTEAQPLFVTLPGRGRYAVRALHVPKVLLYTGLREKLALQLLKVAPGPSTQTLLAELENLEARITAARHVSIQPGSAEEHDDLADALALAVWLAREYEVAREDARRRSMRVTRPPPSAAAWT